MILYGASGHGLVIADILVTAGQGLPVFWDDAERAGFPYPVCGPASTLPEGEILILAIGSNAIRRQLAGHYQEDRYGLAIHPSAILAASVEVGVGTVVMAGVIVNPFSHIGRHVILNTGCRVDHECVLGDYVHVSPGAVLAGNVTVGEESWIGAGAVVKQGIRIGARCTVGAGSVVLRDIPDDTVVVGNPARVLRTVDRRP